MTESENDQWLKQYEEATKQQINLLLRRTNLPLHSFILDCGAGEGKQVAYFRSLGYTNTFGLDIDPAMLESAIHQGSSTQSSFIEADFFDLPFANSVDLMTMFSTGFSLNSGVDPKNFEELIFSCNSAIKPGGYLLATLFDFDRISHHPDYSRVDRQGDVYAIYFHDSEPYGFRIINNAINEEVIVNLFDSKKDYEFGRHNFLSTNDQLDLFNKFGFDLVTQWDETSSDMAQFCYQNAKMPTNMTLFKKTS